MNQICYFTGVGALFGVLLGACDGCTVPKPPVPVPQPLPTSCEIYCERVEALKCAEAWGIDPEDGTCLEFCTDTLRRDGFCPAAAIDATNCAEIDERASCEL